MHHRAARAAAAVTAMLAAFATAVAVIVTGPAAASAGTSNWITTGWNIHLLNQASPSTAAHFFNTAGSYGTGPDLANDPVLDGFAAGPVLVYTSYTQFASDLQSGAISYPYHWVSYDPESWPQTPLAEQQNPGTYLPLFAQLAHAHGYQVIETPGRDLGLVAGAACPKQSSETLNQWYVRCDIAAMAAQADIYIVQDQVNTTSPAVYDWLYTSAQAQAHAVNSHVMVDAGLSTNYGTPAQMAAAAQSAAADGYYITITGSGVSQAVAFFQDMQAAGY